MKKTKVCLNCGNSFITYKDGMYCSLPCYYKDRWSQGGKCKACGKPTQLRYCSRQCQRDYWNKNDYHIYKKKRMQERKKELIDYLGGCCKLCGNNDIRVLDIHHKNSTLKKRPPHLHYTVGNRLREWDKNKENLELLCANCHRIHTWEKRNYGKV